MFRGLLYCTLLALVASHEVGPPLEACQSMTPDPRADPNGHGVAPLSEEAPYVIIASSDCYGGDNNADITVTVMAEMPGCLPMEGLFLQAKPTAQTDGHMGAENHGTWNVNDNNEQLQTLECFNITDSALGHQMKLPYKRTVEVKWTGPATDEGPITIYGTLVRSQTRFFVGVASESITYSATCAFDTPTASTPDACEETGMGEGPASSEEESSSAVTIYGVTTVLALTVLLYTTLVRRT